MPRDEFPPFNHSRADGPEDPCPICKAMLDELARGRWAVYDLERGWLVDTCAGATWSWKVEYAVWFSSPRAATEACEAADISTLNLLVVRVY